MEKATSPTRRMLRARPASREDEPDILSRLPTSILEDRIAGISANSKALTTETPSVNVSTAVFSPTLANRGMSFGPKRTIRSEERRVGKECRYRRATTPENKKR